MTHKGEENLKRGNLGPQPHGGFLAPPPPGGRPENFAAARQRDESIRDRARKDFDGSLEVIAEELTSLTATLVRRHARLKEVPPRASMDVLREFRQTLEAVNEARRARGAVAEAESFFATVDARYQEAAQRMADGPRPPTVVPA